MKKNDLLRSIAEKGYDVGFGAKKHFATYDIVEKTPGFISFISLAFGIIALAIDDISNKLVSSVFIILGVVGLYVSLNDSKKKEYAEAGVGITKLYYRLKALYFNVKAMDESEDGSGYQKELSEIEEEFYSLSISKQIMFSNWYAHYKFFWELQIDWVAEQRRFRFFRDKVPLSFLLFVLVVIFLSGIYFSDLISYVCR
ncbi:SLATT domain-containing protein [Halomonas koreensis]|uniref:SLATT domain-containing protein n=1 Tax=Halomonas koreensis TaxID=245385 RepID=A0ABU1G1A0_9GAMM|nr:SLATT domain-containing protein [Halomonas koreensis]MDR5866247.1 SLATT domain-containing protein [Halomonas koreensis]